MTSPTAGARAALLLLAAALPAASSDDPAQDAATSGPAWDARAAEHLLNRAGFGARPAGIEAAVAAGREAVVGRLLEGDLFVEEPFYARLRSVRNVDRFLRDLDRDERRQEVRRMRAEDSRQLTEFVNWWFEQMVHGDDPLRERMTLFWHGFFTSSQQDVKNSHEMIVQNQLLRRNALGSFRALLHDIARDPAMLEYLDNDDNRREHPNENFARELMELFTLGEGNYTELDVKEAARAFTGWTDRYGDFRFSDKRHDDGPKTILGSTGEFDGADVLELLLAQDACARHVCRRLLTYLEGVAPDDARLDEYAAVLRDGGYELAPVLSKLFHDPRFYADDVVGTRIASPVDFLVGHARRLGSEPPARFLAVASAALGERLFYPTNVKGWEGGRAWITTSTLMQRANLAGVLVGEVRLQDFLTYDPLDDSGTEQPPDEEMFAPSDEMSASSDEEAAPSDEMESVGDEGAARDTGRFLRRRLGQLRGLRDVSRMGWRPRLRLTARLQAAGASGDGELVDALLGELLAVDVSRATRDEVLARLKHERRALGVKNGQLLTSLGAEDVLRRVAHLILSLPEAQLD